MIFGDGSSGNSYFQIDGDKLVIAKNIDFDSGKLYNIRVIAVDNTGLNLEKTIAIDVNYVPTAPKAISLNTNKIKEN